ncbi:hypothetical protein MPC4_70001 [Methylocella tundrae]|uniref:Uncharacterized protein n=1 Tax=Methylocella tundrae TaxID=227605 RepID=A0A8B6MB23_METTU|nr:hypothetical protein MPC4_70001 [Methylocella tundrae]
MRLRLNAACSFLIEWSRSIDQKSLQIQKLEHIPVDQIEPIRPEYALGHRLIMAQPDAY